MRGKPIGICRQAAKNACTLVEKMEICQGGVTSLAQGPNRLRAESELTGRARWHQRLIEWGKMGPPVKISLGGITVKYTAKKLREESQAAKDVVFDAVQAAILKGDAEFFERMAAVVRIEKANKEQGVSLPDGTRADRAVDQKGSKICHYLIHRSIATPDTKVSSSEIRTDLEEALGSVEDDGEVRRICRQLGINLPFVPGSIPSGFPALRGH